MYKTILFIQWFKIFVSKKQRARYNKGSFIVFYGHFYKNVTYLLHSMAFVIKVKWRKGLEIGRTIGLGSDDF